MNKKYQVFVSSTYVDLIAERQEVMHALLELDCIPAGMELFPAADQEQWELIKDVIDECDYYVLILGGRYGSLGPDGIGYTEMEYRYALETKKPIIAFLHQNPDSLPSGKTEQTPEGKNMFQAFRDLARQKPCKFWSNAAELGAVVSRGLVKLQRRQPGIGWVRGNTVSNQEATQEILKLRKQIEQLEIQLEQSRIQAPPGTEKLSQGEDNIDIKCTVEISFIEPFDGTYAGEYSYSGVARLTWNQIFYSVSPLMIDELPEQSLFSTLEEFVKSFVIFSEEDLSERPHYIHHEVFSMNYDDFLTILVQLRALGLIQKSLKNRDIKDKSTYWTLTPYGEIVMNQVRAKKK